MSSRFIIDLNKNEEVAALLADLNVGDKVEVIASIVTKDDQTATFEVEEVDEAPSNAGADDNDDGEDDEEGEDSPALKVMRGGEDDE